MKRFGYIILGLLLKGIFSLARILPDSFMYRLSKRLSIIYFLFSRRYKRRIKRNLTIAFGKSFESRKIKQITQELAENLGLNFAETLISATDKKDSILNNITINGIEHLDTALSQGKGVLAFSAHLGNFTLIGLKMLKAGYPFHMLVKEPKYKAVARAFRILQQGQGGRFIYVEPWDRALRQILTCLRRNDIVCLLADEKKRKTGIYVDYFGYPAPTAIGPSVLSLRTGAPLVPIFIVRGKDGSHNIFIEPQLKLNLNGKKQEDIPVITAAYTKVIEQYVRKYPEQSFWINNRWKKKTRDRIISSK